MPSEQLILQTKIQIPQLRGKILARRRILNPLLANRDKKLITVCADAGYGKSTLLAQFCAELGEAIVYYTLDQSDNDLATFVNYILEGMQRSFPGFGDRTRQAARQTPYVNIVLGTLINEFVQKIPDDFYLILDDHHHLEQNPEISRAVEYLVKHAPANLHLIIASRTTSSLSLTHYLAKQELYQVDRNALRFTLKEIQELLKEVYNLKVPDTDIARIERHTEGWITGIQLILQKIRDAGGEKANETLNGYLSSGEELFNYFAEEVFEHQPREIQDFLIKTSILELLNPEIVNYLLKIRKAGDFFRYLETGHIFITRVGDGFRYHPIFKEFLTKKLTGYYPQKVVRVLNNNLGDYFRDKRDFSSAVNHYLVAENYAQAAKVIEKNYHYWRAVGNFSAFINLVRRFPESLTDRFPHLLLLAGKYYLYLGKNSEVLKITRKLVVRFGKERNYDGIAQVHYLNGYVHLLQMNQRQAVSYMKRAGKWAQKIKPKTRLEILIALGIIYRIYDRYRESETNLAAALKLAKRMRDPDEEIEVLKNYAYLYWAMSDYRRADRTFNELFQKYREDKIPVDFGKLYTDAAFIALNNHNLEKSLYYLSGAEKIAEQYNDQRTLMYSFFYRADLYKYQGENRKAIASYERTMEMNREFNDRFLDFYSRLYLSNIHIRLGELSTARSLLDKVDTRLLPKDSPQINIDYFLVRSALETAGENFGEARAFLNRARARAARIDNPFQRMAVEYAWARYYQKSGRGLEARECVDRVIAAAQKNHYEVFLIDEGRWDLSLIELGLRPGPDHNYLLNILEEINTDAARVLLARQQIKKGVYDIAATFFGPLEIRNSRNKTITPHWRTKKGKALFAFLIINRSYGCTKDQLIDAFWPGKDLHEAAHSLQVEISSLRALLSELGNTEIKNKEIITFKNQKYTLDQRFLVRTDVQEFDDLVREGEVACDRHPHDAERIYARALGLYRGDFGLDITDEWCENIRRSYRQTVIRILKKMGKYHLASGRYRPALEYYRRALALDDYDEEIHIAIMRCAAALGDQRTVKSQYAMLVRKLAEAGIANPPVEAVRLLRSRPS
jgi:ATP/maltotriose-dependent transcriptional regulator MalT/two-component SAPR family response regulator